MKPCTSAATGISAVSACPCNGSTVRTAQPVYFDGYATNRLTGSFILIEPGTNATVAAGLLLPPTEIVKPEGSDYFI